ncbi:MAG: metalloprotease, partial [Flavobacteriaceae bacterium]|nr:metalloprotease [Flavobacteriaceae bacterium]
MHFLETKLGKYPHDKLILSELDIKENPVVGLNQLPDFIRPFPEGFVYELNMLKGISENWMENTFYMNARQDKWFTEGLAIFLMMQYMDTYYPDMKISGLLSDVWGLRYFHATQLPFNRQYAFLYLHTARLNIHQSLETSRDSLIKYNKNIANQYKAGAAFYALNSFSKHQVVNKVLPEFYKANATAFVKASDFIDALEAAADQDISWFRETYVKSNKNIDFKLKKVKKIGDSVSFVVKNKTRARSPIPLAGFKDGKKVFERWLTDIDTDSTIILAHQGADKLVLNPDQIIPEFIERDNYKTLKKFPALNRPIQFKPFLDAENPAYSQVFFIPEFDFNVYDGLIVGISAKNTTLLHKAFKYSVLPMYGFNSNRLLGRASVGFIDYNEKRDSDYFATSYSFSGNTFSFAPESRFYRVIPRVSFIFKDQDLRSNRVKTLSFRQVTISRNNRAGIEVEEPDYSVFNARYNYSDKNLLNFFTYSLDYQLYKDFSKLSFTSEYRRLFKNNRQINFRLFLGAFLFNDTPTDSDFFSFALDRPTDYLFDFNYYGRSEDDSGVFSQQL